jgi:hypothetical protein
MVHHENSDGEALPEIEQTVFFKQKYTMKKDLKA